MKKIEIDITDPRIDGAFETKPIEEVFDFIKKNPATLTSPRLVKLIARCTKEEKQGKMRDILNSRLLEYRTSKNAWDEYIVSAMIAGQYFRQDYDYPNLIALVKKYEGDGNAMQLAFQWFKNYGYAYYYDDLLKLKPLFTQEYVQKRLEAGNYRELLTLAALDIVQLPELTDKQISEFRKYMFEVLTTNYYEENISAAQSYRKDRDKRIETLWKKYPALFMLEDLVTVALTSYMLCDGIYQQLPIERKIISQETIARLFADKQCQLEIMRLILNFNIRLNKANRKKIVAWVKDIHPDDIISYGPTHKGQLRNALYTAFKKRYKISISFDEFLTTMTKLHDERYLDIKAGSEQKLMNAFAWNKKNLSLVCTYYYRSTLESKAKKHLIMDLFFWEYLPWKMLHADEKVLLNEHIASRAIKHPEQTIKLARKHPSIVKLSENTKLWLFRLLAQTGSSKKHAPYKEIDFGSGNAKEITVSAEDFQKLAAEELDLLYQMMKIPQIKITFFVKPEKFAAWWDEQLYTLILMQYKAYVPTEGEAITLLKTFSHEMTEYYFVPAWQAMPENVRPSAVALYKQINKKSCEGKNLAVFERLLKYKLVPLDDLIIKKLVDLYRKEFNQYWVESIAALEIPGAAELSLQLKEQKINSFLG